MDGWHGAPLERGGETIDDLELSLDSPAIKRLVEEVRTEDHGVPRGYNRTFNRHNR